MCPGLESNQHVLADTAPSRRRVYLFRHLGHNQVFIQRSRGRQGRKGTQSAHIRERPDVISFTLQPVTIPQTTISSMIRVRTVPILLLFVALTVPSAAQDSTPESLVEVASLDSIRNWVPISEHLFTGGQVANEQVPLLADLGVQTVINLATPRQEVNGQEGFHVASSGMTYVNIPVVWQEPTLEDVDQFFRVMKANEGRTVYVHCVANFRGSAFTFLYRVLVEGIPEDEARKDMEAIWDPVDYPAWDALINQALTRPRFQNE